MKSFFLKSALLGLAVLASAGTPQAQDQAEFRAKLEAKLGLPFISHGNWLLDFDQAKAKAKEEGKVIFVYFSRSYAP